MKEKETVLEKLCRECKQAFTSRTPIIYVLTDDLELINQLIDSDVLTPQYIRIPNEGIRYASKYKESLRRIYSFLKANRGQFTIQDLVQKNKLPQTDAERILFTYLKDDKTIDRMKFIDSYERHYSNMLPPVINARFFSYTQCDINFKKDNIDDMEPMLQVWWNYKETDETNKALHKYVGEYENSQANSIYKQSILLICSSEYKMYSGLNNYVSVIDVKLPEDWEIQAIIKEFLEETQSVAIKTEHYLNKLVTALKGYGRSQIRRLLYGILIKAKNDLNKYDAIKDIYEDKKQMVKKSDVLELVEPNENTISVGGQETLLKWLRDQEYDLKNPKEIADNMGKTPSKGVLVCGVPGTGKSLSAKQASILMDLPLLKMDMGSLMNSYIGASEAKMRNALKLAEAMSPCILWLDELEKGFAGIKKGGHVGDSGTFSRMFGTFLVWMQEVEYPVFIYATSNDISEMPDEFWRNGRFDALHGMFMPTRSECVEIFKNTLNTMASRVKKAVDAGECKAALFEADVTSNAVLGECVDLCIKGERRKFVTGADIYTIINSAMNVIKRDLQKTQTQAGNSSYGVVRRETRIHALQFKNAIDTALEEISSFSEGIGKMNTIARTYITLLANNSFKISGNEGLITSQMFDLEAFEPTPAGEEPKCVININRANTPDNMYDQLLLETLVKKINKLAQTS